MAQRARAHTNVPVDLVPVDLVAQNKELEERVQQLQARCDQLERDLAVEKLEGAQRSAEELKKQVTRTIRFLSAGIAFPLSLVFYYYAWPALNGRPHEQIVHGYALFLISTPLGQCGMLLSILPNDEKLARLMSTVPSVVGFAFPAAALVVATVRNVQLHWPNCADSSASLAPAAACAACVSPIVTGLIAIAFMFVSFVRFSLPNLRRKDGRFVVPARLAIQNVWAYIRRTHAAVACFIVAANLPTAFCDPPAHPLDVAAWLTVAAAFMLLAPVIFRQSNRQRVHALLGRLDVRGEANAAAAIASMVGVGRSVKEVLAIARQSFYVLPFDALSESDFEAGNTDTGLHNKTKRVKLGDCDAFLSHSWSDDYHLKWQQLVGWAAKFTADRASKAPPTLWLDKASIQQDRVEENLAVLPIFLAGCQQLLILLGPTYCTRLWCVLEVFTWLRMGGRIDRIVLLPFGLDRRLWQPFGVEGGGIAAAESVKAGAEAARQAFRDFDARTARCFLDHERQHLLGILEAGFGTLTAFNATIRAVFGESLDSSRTDRPRRDSFAELTRSRTRSLRIPSAPSAQVV